ncbi:hypothetical protein LCGC14_1106470 [marine sediment metagenome]|uniref:Uncharacterized protein n=1 Tax=marine sediment metagenome TaxID=412755 RepID=A0A0F9M7Y2_9ZZZZ
MAGNDSPVKMPELNLTPESERGVDLDVGMKQVMAVLTAYFQDKRVTLRASPGGVLYVCNSELGDIFHVPATSGNFLYTGGDIQCSEVMVMGHPDNTGKVWAKSKVVATVDNAWPLAAGEVIKFSITNLNMLRLLIVTNTEKAIIAYTM